MKIQTKPSPMRRVFRAITEAHSAHRQRHSPSGFGFAFADRIDYLDPAKWDQVTRGASILLKRNVIRVIEEHGPDNVQPRYAMVFRDTKPVAALAVQILEFSGDRLAKPNDASEVRPGKRAALKRAIAPISEKAVSRLRE